MILRGEAAAALLATLHERCFPPGERWDARAMAELLRMPGAAASVRNGPDEEPAGLALWRVAADEAELLTLAVRPDARRRGFGATLLRDAATEAARTGAERMLLEVAANNATAAALYRGTGFREIGRRRRYYPDGTDAVVMAAALPLF